MNVEDIKTGKTYTSPRWRGDRKVTRLDGVGQSRVVHFIDLRTQRTGNSPLERFASMATGYGLVANI